MQFLLIAQSGGLNNSLLWPFLIIIALAIVIWLLSWLLFPDPKPKPIGESLKGLSGLDESMATKLQRFGIHSDRDLIRLTPRGQQELESQLDLKDGQYAGWRREILGRWRQAYLPHQLRDVDAIYPDPELGGLYAKKPAEIDDLSKIDGIDHLTANRMNAAGIYTYEQLRLLTPEQRASFARRFNLTGFDFDAVPLHGVTASSGAQRSNGRPDIHATSDGHSDSSVAAATPGSKSEPNVSHTVDSSPGAASLSFASKQSQPTSPAGSSVETGVSSATSSPSTTGNVSSPGIASSAPTTKPANVGSQIPTSKIDAELGRVYTAPPPHRDDLTKLDGIDEAAAKKLNEAGVYTLDQLLSLSPSQQAGFKRRFDLPSIDFGSWLSAKGSQAPDETASNFASHLPTGDTDTTGAGTTQATGNATTETGPKKYDLGYLYVNPPHNADDLTKLDGITPAIARQLNLAGIYRFHQLNTMSSTQRESFKSRFALPYVNFDNWSSVIGQDSGSSATTTGSSASVSGPSSASGSTSTLDSSDATGSSSVSSSATTAASLSSQQQSTRPVGFATATSSLSPSTFASQSQTSGSQAASGASVSPETAGPSIDHPRFGKVYSTAPSDSDRDDLTRLPGIDAARQQRLNAVGIYNFDQIQNLTGAQLQALQTDMEIEGVDFADWQRCTYAWSRGIETTPNVERTYRTGWLHGVRLPEITAGVFDGKQLVAYPEQVVFRGSQAEHWGTKVTVPADGITSSLPSHEIRSDINYVRIRRVDTRESVVTSITKGQLFAPGPNDANGWNGLCESFFGGRHLGVYARDIPNEVETRFGLGGWGFGHRFDENDQQEWCWAGRLIQPTTFEVSVGRIGSKSGTVVFRSNDPTMWNSRVRVDANHFAMPIDGVTHPISFLRLLRVDTGKAIVIRVDRASLLRRGESPRLGWNGLCDEFSGGHHLGIYHRDAPQNVEICYGEGGWGFGHPFDENNRQAYGWGGQSIGGSTIFEISVLEKLPDYLRHELME